MDSLLIGKYIYKLRKNKNLTQKELADKLGVSFQAVSKWENGETLPDTSLLLELADILDTTVDKLLNGGIIVMKNKNVIHVEDVVLGFNAIKEVRRCFGDKSLFYQGMIEGINNKMNMDLETYLEKDLLEPLYTEVILQGILNGAYVDILEVKKYINNDKYVKYIEDYLNKLK